MGLNFSFFSGVGNDVLRALYSKQYVSLTLLPE